MFYVFCVLLSSFCENTATINSNSAFVLFKISIYILFLRIEKISIHMKNIKHHLEFFFPRYALMLCAILPITENNDWIFYTVAILILLFFAATFVCIIQAYKRNTKNLLRHMLGDSRDNLCDIMIYFAGIVVCYSMGLNNQAYIWWFVLVCTVAQVLFPTKLNLKDRE